MRPGTNNTNCVLFFLIRHIILFSGLIKTASSETVISKHQDYNEFQSYFPNYNFLYGCLYW